MFCQNLRLKTGPGPLAKELPGLSFVSTMVHRSSLRGTPCRKRRAPISEHWRAIFGLRAGEQPLAQVAINCVYTLPKFIFRYFAVRGKISGFPNVVQQFFRISR